MKISRRFVEWMLIAGTAMFVEFILCGMIVRSGWELLEITVSTDWMSLFGYPGVPFGFLALAGSGAVMGFGVVLELTIALIFERYYRLDVIHAQGG